MRFLQVTRGRNAGQESGRNKLILCGFKVVKMTRCVDSLMNTELELIPDLETGNVLDTIAVPK
jgi:hypothetical protein